MPRQSQSLIRPTKGQLKPSDIEGLPPGRYTHFEISHLSIRVQPNSRSWLFSFHSPERIEAGKKVRVERGLGAYDPRTIQQIERRAIALNGELAQGRDPFLERDKQKQDAIENREELEVEKKVEALLDTKFKKAFDLFCDYKRPAWQQRKTALMPVSEKNWRSMLNSHAQPLFELPFREVSKKTIAEVVSPIWLTNNYSAVRLYNRIRDVHYWWAAKHDLEVIPLPESAKRLYLGETKRVRNPHRDLPYTEMPDLWQRLSDFQDDPGVLYVRLAILTGARPAEMRELRWDQIKTTKLGKQIQIDASETKTQQTYLWPVLPAIEAVLGACEALGSKVWVIPSPARKGADKPLSEAAGRVVLDRLGLKGIATVHGFRKALHTFALQEAQFEPWVAEALLQHLVQNTYFRPVDIWAKRCEALTEYHKYLGAV
jgi:integrase